PLAAFPPDRSRSIPRRPLEIIPISAPRHRAFRRVLGEPTRFGSFVAVGLASWLMWHASWPDGRILPRRADFSRPRFKADKALGRLKPALPGRGRPQVTAMSRQELVSFGAAGFGRRRDRGWAVVSAICVTEHPSCQWLRGSRGVSGGRAKRLGLVGP